MTEKWIFRRKAFFSCITRNSNFILGHFASLLSERSHLPRLFHVLRLLQLLSARIWSALQVETCAREQNFVLRKIADIFNTF
jgi:hypothetical protein